MSNRAQNIGDCQRQRFGPASHASPRIIASAGAVFDPRDRPQAGAVVVPLSLLIATSLSAGPFVAAYLHTGARRRG